MASRWFNHASGFSVTIAPANKECNINKGVAISAGDSKNSAGDNKNSMLAIVRTVLAIVMEHDPRP